MGKAALLALGVIVVAESYQQRGQLTFSAAASNNLSVSQGEVLARNAATAGFEVARERITRRNAAVYSPVSGRVSGADFEGRSITSTDGASADLKVQGTYQNADGTTSYYLASGRFERRARYSEQAPTFLNYGLITEESLSMNGNILVDTLSQNGGGALLTEGERRNERNANIHTNGSLTVTGNAALIRGFGTYANSGSGRSTLFRPYYNPTNAESFRRVNRVDIPLLAFTPAQLAASEGADSLSTPAGNLTLSGIYNFVKTKNGVQVGTRQNPFVWHIRGNVTISGTAVFSGYVMFLIDGNLDMGGNAVAGYGTAPAESHVAWYVGNNISMRGNTQLWGQFLAKNQVSFSGTPRIYGSITANSASISGTPKIYFQEPSSALTHYWDTPTYQMELISYLERPIQRSAF